MTLDAPTFVIIGAQKAGTTSLYHYLAQHPEVFMSPVKEPRFFSYVAKVEAGAAKPGREAVKTLAAYRSLFAGTTARSTGEASVAYLDIPGTAAVMKRYLPHARLIALLRDPVDRAYSHYLMRCRKGAEHASFEEAIAAGRYVQGGCYHQKLLPYFKLFDADRIGLFLYDALRADPLALLREVFRFLEIDEAFVPDVTVRHNVGGRPRHRSLSRLFTMQPLNAWIKRTAPPWLVRAGISLKQLGYHRPPLPEAVQGDLRRHYAPDVRALQRLTGLDLSAWLPAADDRSATRHPNR